MDKACNSLLFTRVEKKGFRPEHVAEVGVWRPHTSNVYNYISQGVRTTLVEPDPQSIQLIKETLSADNVTLHEVAVCDFSGEVELCQRDSSTFVSDLSSSPALVNDDCDVSDSETFIARAVTFDVIDDGTIDLLSVDTEGSEWFVIKNMKSRPAVLSIETHGGMYVNPYILELRNWLKQNGYNLWFKDMSDSVYILDDVIQITYLDRMTALVTGFKIRLKSFRKKLKKKLFG